MKSVLSGAACLAVFSLLLTACTKNEDNTMTPNPGTPSVSRLFVSNADTASSAKNLQVFDLGDSTKITPTAELTNGAKDGNGVAFSASKNLLFQVSRLQKSVRVYDLTSSLTATSMPKATFTDAALSSGRELAYDETNDVLYVANNTDSTVRVYDKASTLNGTATGKVLKLSGQPWGIHFDQTNNRLFVLIDMAALRIETYNNPAALAGGKVVPTSQFTINGTGTNGATARLHGLTYSAKRNTLLVTEIGAAAGGNFATDGGIYILENFSSIANNASVTPTRTIYGSNTGLGNPVDVAFDDRDGKNRIYVAEKANKKILVFRLSDNGNVAPSLAYTTPFAPEAIYVDAR